MKRRILMVSAMILLLGSQMPMYAHKKFGPVNRRPGIEMHIYSKPGGPMHGKAICQGDVLKLQEFYWKKYRVRLSYREAENILIKDMRDRDRKPHSRGPHGLPRR